MGSEGTQMVNRHHKSSPINKQVQSQRDEHHCPEWLPHDWITEIRTRKNGAKEGAKYKCYIDPSTGKTFYSKPEVARYLKERQPTASWFEQKKKGSFASTSTSDSVHPLESQKSDPERKEPQSEKLLLQKRNSTTRSQKSDPVASEVQQHRKLHEENTISSEVIVENCVNEGLPPGWIKEIRIKRSSGKVRKDPFYVDSVSGYVFRSRVEVLRYLETGELSRYAYKRKNSVTADSNFTYDASLPTINRNKRAVSTRKQLFEGDGSPANSPASALSKKGHAAVSSLEEGLEPLIDGTEEDVGRKSESRKEISIKRRPHQSSRRLVGIKDDSVMLPKQYERVLRSSNEKITPERAILSSRDQIVDGDPRLNEESDFCFSSAIWTDDDPCLDFAIKTLTCAIPLDDNADQQQKDAILLDINEPPGSSKDCAFTSSAQNNVSPLVIPGLLSSPVGSCSSLQNGSTMDHSSLDSGKLLAPAPKIGPSKLDVPESKQSDSRRKTRRKRML